MISLDIPRIQKLYAVLSRHCLEVSASGGEFVVWGMGDHCRLEIPLDGSAIKFIYEWGDVCRECKPAADWATDVLEALS